MRGSGLPVQSSLTMPLTVIDTQGIPATRRERIEAAVQAGGKHIKDSPPAYQRVGEVRNFRVPRHLPVLERLSGDSRVGTLLLTDFDRFKGTFYNRFDNVDVMAGRLHNLSVIR